MNSNTYILSLTAHPELIYCTVLQMKRMMRRVFMFGKYNIFEKALLAGERAAFGGLFEGAKKCAGSKLINFSNEEGKDNFYER